MGEIQYQASFTIASDLLNNWPIVYHSLVIFFNQEISSEIHSEKKSEIAP